MTKIKLLYPDSKMPVKKTKGASAYDVHTIEDIALRPGERATVSLGFALSVPDGYEVQIRPRSGFAHEHGLYCHFGTIDSDYRGEVRAILINLGEHTFRLSAGERIAQMAIVPLAPREVQELHVVDELDETERGAGGLGHTGTK